MYVDTDPAFVDIVRAKVEEQGLTKVKEVLLLGNDAWCSPRSCRKST